MSTFYQKFCYEPVGSINDAVECLSCTVIVPTAFHVKILQKAADIFTLRNVHNCKFMAHDLAMVGDDE
jgi:hypothetical protein